MSSTVPKDVLDTARSARRVAVLTGAGMSAESGIPTFRDKDFGLWTKVDPEELATPTAWFQDPARVWAWYAWRARVVQKSFPNAGHRALATWEKRERTTLDVVTQNVDNLHERGGSRAVTHLHGSLFAYRCDTCGEPYEGDLALPDQPVERLPPPACPRCLLGHIRPDIVWFGEPLDRGRFERAIEAVESADLVLVVGTSGMVYPAAGLPAIARGQGVPVVEINPRESDLSDTVDLRWEVSAATGLPRLVEALER